MKGTPFKTRRQLSSPYMLTDPSLSGVDFENQEVLQEPVVTEAPQEPSTTAEQMQVEPVVVGGDKDKDKERAERYKKRNVNYNAKLKLAEEDHWNDSAEDVSAELKLDAGSTINADGSVTIERGRYDAPPEDKWEQTLNVEEIFDSMDSWYKGGTRNILGEQQGTGHYTAKGVTKEIFKYGTIETTKRPNKTGGFHDTYNEIITITAKNHPLYGNTYTRAVSKNPEYKTVKPVEDLRTLLESHDLMFSTGLRKKYSMGEFGPGYAFPGFNKRKDGKHEWDFHQQGNLIKYIEEGKLTKAGGFTVRERTELVAEVKNLFASYWKQHVTSTKLNKK